MAQTPVGGPGGRAGLCGWAEEESAARGLRKHGSSESRLWARMHADWAAGRSGGRGLAAEEHEHDPSQPMRSRPARARTPQQAAVP